jgi:hypothetical protein
MALHGREQDGDICGMADKGTCLKHGFGIWERDDLWPCESEQSRVILQDLLGIVWRECGRVV